MDDTHALPSLPVAVKSRTRWIVALTAKPAARLKLVAEQAYHGDK